MSFDPERLVLCSGSLGSVPLDTKLRAAAAAGFGWVSLYGHEYRAAVEAGVDCAALLRELGLRVAEVDGVAVTMGSDETFAEALDIARAVEARSITIVETSAYDPADTTQVTAAIEAFRRHCDLADRHGVLVHIEPFAWSDLCRTKDCAVIINEAGRSNGGLLLDLWHLVRGPDEGNIDPALHPSSVFEVQLADTVGEPWDNVRDECMGRRLLPGQGHADLSNHVAELATVGALPLVGVELFGRGANTDRPGDAAAACWTALQEVLADAFSGG